MRILTICSLATFFVAAVTLGFVPAAVAEAKTPSVAQVVALDECDPVTFNAVLGPDFCKNVALAALGYATTLSDLFAKAQKRTPDPGWDFEPDTVKIMAGIILTVVDQGGEPLTFTEVAQFGGGFIADLNHGEATVPNVSAAFPMSRSPRLESSKPAMSTSRA